MNLLTYFRIILAIKLAGLIGGSCYKRLMLNTAKLAGSALREGERDVYGD